MVRCREIGKVIGAVSPTTSEKMLEELNINQPQFNRLDINRMVDMLTLS